MVTAVALVVDHERVAAAPGAIEEGDAVKVAVGNGGTVTVTMAEAVVDPVALVAVIV